MKSRRWSPSAMPSRCDLNSCTARPALTSSKRCASTLIIAPLWYSLGPNTLKNFRPAHCGGRLFALGGALRHRHVEQMLAPAVEVHRPQPLQRGQRPVIVEIPARRRHRSLPTRRRSAARDVAVHQSSSRIDIRKLVSMTRSPSVAVVSEIAPRWKMASSAAAAQPVHQFGRRDQVGQLPLGEIAPFAVMTEHVADRHVGAAGVIQRGHDVRSDKTGAPGHQQHACPASVCSGASFAPVAAGRQLRRVWRSRSISASRIPLMTLRAGRERLPTGEQLVSVIAVKK